ncbi:hypothetical protein D3C84_570910 [compost metagenome]
MKFYVSRQEFLLILVARKPEHRLEVIEKILLSRFLPRLVVEYLLLFEKLPKNKDCNIAKVVEILLRVLYVLLAFYCLTKLQNHLDTRSMFGQKYFQISIIMRKYRLWF